MRRFAVLSLSLLASALLVPNLGLAQPPPGPRPLTDEPPPIADPPPASPIDRPRRARGSVEVKEEPKPPAPPLPARAPGTIWVGWTVGSGYGWHSGQNLEQRGDLEVGSAFGPGGLGQFGPEVGYQLNDRVAVSLQSRHQIVPRKVSDPDAPANAAQWAHSLLARFMYRYPLEALQLYLGGVAGGGTGIRFRIDPQPSRRLDNSDTVRGGPFVLGPAAGLVWPLVSRLSAVGEARILVGVPDVAAMGELNLGLQFDL